MAHSKGEWQVRNGIMTLDIVTYHNGWSAPICSLVEARFCENGDVAMCGDEIDANAALIRSAPELLAALQALRDAAGDFLQDEAGLRAMAMANTAIERSLSPV